MKYRRLLAATMAAILLLSALSGCGNSTTTETEAESTATEEETTTQAVEYFQLDEITDVFYTLSGVSGDTVVATAGDIEITAAEYLAQVAYTADELLYSYGSYYGMTELPWDDQSSDISLAEAISSDALDTATLYAFYPAVAEREGYTVDQSAWDAAQAQLDSEIAGLGGEEIAQQTFWCIPLTQELYLDWMMSESYYTVVAQDYVGENATKTYTDEEYLALAEDGGYYRVQHIMFSCMSDEINATGTGYDLLSDEDYAEKLALAESVLLEIQSSDDPIATFQEKMEEYSEDGRNTTTGELNYPEGYTIGAGQMTEDFESAVLALEENQISQVVETVYGYHIMLRLPLELTDDLRSTLSADVLYGVMTQWVEEYTAQPNQALDTIDVQQFYENLELLRAQVSLELGL